MINVENIKLQPVAVDVEPRHPGIDVLIKKYGPDYSLNLSPQDNHDISLTFTFVTDKNGHVNIINYGQQKYKYKYIIAKSLLARAREFTMDCLELMNINYDRIPMKQQPIEFNIDFNKVYYGIQKEVYNASFDEISDEEFNDEMSLSRVSQPVCHDMKTTVVEDIDTFINKAPKEFFDAEDCLFYSDNYIDMNSFSTEKKISGSLKTISGIFM